MIEKEFDHLLLVGYRTELASDVDLTKLQPKFQAPGNYGAEAAARYLQRKQEEFAECAAKMPYLSRITEVSYVVLPDRQAMEGRGLSPMALSYPTSGAMHLCRKINNLWPNLAIIAFDMRTLAKVFGIQCAIESHKPPQGCWLGSNNNLDMEHLLVPGDFGGLSLSIAIKMLGLDGVPADYQPCQNPLLDVWVCMQGLVHLHLFEPYHQAIEAVAPVISEQLEHRKNGVPAGPIETPLPVTETQVETVLTPAVEVLPPTAAADSTTATATVVKKKKVFRPRPVS